MKGLAIIPIMLIGVVFIAVLILNSYTSQQTIDITGRTILNYKDDFTQTRIANFTNNSLPQNWFFAFNFDETESAYNDTSYCDTTPTDCQAYYVKNNILVQNESDINKCNNYIHTKPLFFVPKDYRLRKNWTISIKVNTENMTNNTPLWNGNNPHITFSAFEVDILNETSYSTYFGDLGFFGHGFSIELWENMKPILLNSYNGWVDSFVKTLGETFECQSGNVCSNGTDLGNNWTEFKIGYDGGHIEYPYTQQFDGLMLWFYSSCNSGLEGEFYYKSDVI